MKKQRFFMLGIITVLVAVLSLTFVSSTFAKYTSTVTGSDKARVAKWAFSTVDLAAKTVEFDLFKSDYTESHVDKDGNGSEVVIAPGTTGKFEFTVTNNSEVDAIYSVIFESNEAGVPLVFSEDGTNWVGTLEDLNVSNAEFNMTNTATVTVHWKWAFEGGEAAGWTDANDTSLGTAGTLAEPTVKITLVFTQVD